MTNYTTQFIQDCCDKYEDQEVKKIQQQSNFQLVFTDDKVYDLDKIVLLRRRDVGNTASCLHVIDKAEDTYADEMLVFLAIDHLLFNLDEEHQYIYEQSATPDYITREVHAVTGINNIVTYEPYDHIADIANYIAKIKLILDPDLNPELLEYLYEQIPSQIRESDGFIQMNTNGDDNFFDVLDIFDPDDIL
jgi:hypothetical protein